MSPNGSSRIPGQILGEIDHVRPKHQLVMLGAKRLGNVSRVPEFVVFGFGEPDRKRLDRFRSHAGHGRHHGARVDAAAEKRADRHVAHFVQLDRLAEQIAQLARSGRLGRLFVGMELDIPVAVHAQIADAADRRDASRRAACARRPRCFARTGVAMKVRDGRIASQFRVRPISGSCSSDLSSEAKASPSGSST